MLSEFHIIFQSHLTFLIDKWNFKTIQRADILVYSMNKTMKWLDKIIKKKELRSNKEPIITRPRFIRKRRWIFYYKTVCRMSNLFGEWTMQKVCQSAEGERKADIIKIQKQNKAITCNILPAVVAKLRTITQWNGEYKAAVWSKFVNRFV